MRGADWCTTDELVCPSQAEEVALLAVHPVVVGVPAALAGARGAARHEHAHRGDARGAVAATRGGRARHRGETLVDVSDPREASIFCASILCPSRPHDGEDRGELLLGDSKVVVLQRTRSGAAEDVGRDPVGAAGVARYTAPALLDLVRATVDARPLDLIANALGRLLPESAPPPTILIAASLSPDLLPDRRLNVLVNASKRLNV